MAISKKKYFDRLATLYDKKTVEGINSKLAEDDRIFLNHSGLVVHKGDIRRLQEGLFGEKDLLRALHKLEKDLVVFAARYLGRPSDKKRMLDAGSGAGGSAILINKKLRYRIDGYTLSKKQRDFANRAAKKYGVSDTVKFYQGDMLSLTNVTDKTFDLVWACESTEHILREDLAIMFGEFSRVTKPNSRVVIVAWTSRAGLHKDDARIKKAIDKHYLTDIHSKRDYISAAERKRWKLTDILDLTKMSTPYWELRQKSRSATGSEKLFIDGYKHNSLAYILYVFDKAIF